MRSEDLKFNFSLLNQLITKRKVRKQQQSSLLVKGQETLDVTKNKEAHSFVLVFLFRPFMVWTSSTPPCEWTRCLAQCRQMEGLFPRFNEGEPAGGLSLVTLVIDMLLRSPPALFAVNGKGQSRRPGSGRLDRLPFSDRGQWKNFRTSMLRRPEKQGQDKPEA